MSYRVSLTLGTAVLALCEVCDPTYTHMDAACARVLAAVATDHRETVLLTCEAIKRAVEGVGVGAEPIPFGSTVSGLAVETDCDVDLCLTCRPHADDMKLAPEQRMRATVRRARDGLVEGAGATKMLALLSANVPILKFDLPLKARTVPIDLSFNNLNGCRNSELLRILGVADPRLRPLAMLVKLWAKRRGLIGSHQHYFSSYALVLLVVRFLQERGGGALPRGADFCALSDSMRGFTPDDTTAWVRAAPLPESDAAALERLVAPRGMPAAVEQAVRAMLREEPGLNAKRVYAKLMADGGGEGGEGGGDSEGGGGGTGSGGGSGAGGGSADCGGIEAGARSVTPKEVRALVAAIKAGGAAPPPAEPLSALLRAFFAAHARPHAHKEVVSLGAEAPVSKSSKGWVDARARRRYCIEDPLELEFDPARTLTARSMERIHAEFVRADELLSAAADAEDGSDAAWDGVLKELLRSRAEEDAAAAAAAAAQQRVPGLLDEAEAAGGGEEEEEAEAEEEEAVEQAFDLED